MEPPVQAAAGNCSRLRQRPPRAKFAQISAFEARWLVDLSSFSGGRFAARGSIRKPGLPWPVASLNPIW
ncbi:hypothetical protein RSSM_03789 [Rhodopirellula sallentina SM41]|uniref:Uncharacterized protein n=1 Tax=Rhodopirellula sallentina SM41 TaxID=1263870 RepID=M5U010_9BACT|nr:hypothetical protein RSSM_03789 [Rhodopirellula sallentina SM41]